MFPFVKKCFIMKKYESLSGDGIRDSAKGLSLNLPANELNLPGRISGKG